MNIGDTVGSFRITARLGSGGMGEVFLGEQPNIDTKVAIKVLRPEISKDEDHVQRFFNEARAVGRIKHSGIVKIFEGGFHASGHAYLIMELLEGESLAARIKRVGRLPVASVCDVGRQIASILGATHAVGITHRDLKPDNIFIVADAELASGERVKVLDFGIAKLTGTLASGPRTVGTMGTPSYMAPEQWGDAANVDWRADAYALGCVLFEMICGRPPFLGASFADLCAKHLSAQPPTPSGLGIAVPPALEQLVMQLLAKHAAERATSFAELGKALEAIGRTAPPIAPGLAPTLPPSSSSEVPPTLVTMSSSSQAAEPRAKVAPPHQPPSKAPAPSTTLRGAAAEVERPPPRRRSVVAIAAVFGFGIVGGAVAIAMKLSGGSTEKPIDAPPTARSAEPVGVDAEVVVVDAGESGVDVQAIQAELAGLNPFVTINGITLQRHQVTRRELELYLQALRPDARATAGALIPPPHGAPTDPIGGLSQDRARDYCRALGATLPTITQWKRAAGRAWGIDGGDGIGPLQEWTANVDDGLATVLGAHREMDAAQRKAALREPLLKATEAVGGAAAPDVVADLRIGFRCAR